MKSFNDDMPGDGWFQAFLRRHPELSARTSENVTLSNTTLGEQDIKKTVKI